jgi:UDP-N-acetylmuramate dehydrogenase
MILEYNGKKKHMPGIRIRENVPLAPFTTMGVGGPARYFTEARTEAEAIGAIGLAKERGWNVFILGGGSNIVVSDEGFAGLVILNTMKGFQCEQKGGRVYVEANGGVEWDSLVRHAVAMRWQGIENLSGIPGTVGAAPIQNIGAYGQSVGDVIVEVRAIDLSNGGIRMFDHDECGFRYRDSMFRSEAAGRYCITRVRFALIENGAADVAAYHDLEEYFRGREGTPTLADVRRAVLEIRARKGMWCAPDYSEWHPSVGSFFKNPVLKKEDFAVVARRLREYVSDAHDAPWFWAQPDGTVKVSAARLVELGGFPKGYREGSVGISTKHSLAIINCGGARAEEIAKLAQKIQTAVREKFGVELEPEAQFVGFPSSVE